MPISTPPVDPRTAADVARQLQQLLKLYAPQWNDVDPLTGSPQGLSAALIGVSARLTEVLIQRLNQVPQKNFLAFLKLVGAALLPPQPARVPMTFLLAKGSLVDAVVPAGTQVAAPPGPGAKEPVIYETENELVATSAQLASAIVRDPEEDTYADYTSDLITTGSPGAPVFHGSHPIDHVLYLGKSNFLNSPGITGFQLTFDLLSPAGDGLNLRWEIWDGSAWHDITPTPANDGTKSLHQSGTIQFGKVPAAGLSQQNGISQEWVRCVLLTPISQSSVPATRMVRAAQLPQIRSVRMRAHLHNSGVLIDEAYSTGSGLIDLSKDFYPFGEKPRFNETLWLALKEAFSNSGATITLNVQVTPLQATGQTPSTAPNLDDLRVRWEIWNGAWIELGTSTAKGPVSPLVNGNPFSDSTNAFTSSGAVVFTLPANVASFIVNGKESFWIRARIVAGNYGIEAHYEPAAAGGFLFKLATFQAPVINSLSVAYDLDRPPLAQAAALPDTMLSYNDFQYIDLSAINSALTQSYTPFLPSPDARPTLYLGFVLPAGRTAFSNNTMTVFFYGANLQYGEKTIPLAPDVSRGAGDPVAQVTHTFVITNPGAAAITYTPSLLGSQWSPAITLTNSDGSPGGANPVSITIPAGDWVRADVQVTVPPGTSFGASDKGIFRLVSSSQLLYSAEFITFAHEEETPQQQLQLTWEYWNGHKWSTLVVQDGTSNLTTTGLLEFLAPPDFASHTEFKTYGWWLRVRWDTGDYDTDPRIKQVFLNTTMATQTITITHENLGSSDGSKSQTFQTTRTPVLLGQKLQVREPERPSGDDLAAIIADEGPTAVPAATSLISDIWVTWHEVPDFYASGARSRHYTLDHATGEVGFGDGLSGMIPPVGLANISLSFYRTGGGVVGNQLAGSIVQLKTTVPYIDKVVNYIDATGGAEAESMDSLTARAPAEIRHRNRAVTVEDYEDLAHLASPDIARALCVSNRNLVADPFDNMPPVLGNVSLIVVPNTTAPKPQPTIELVRRVQQFISARCPVTASVLVVGPLYLRVDVLVEIGVASLDAAGTVVFNVENALAAFLHPLTGGFSQQGWEFGREPHRSDIFKVIADAPGVDHIRALTVRTTEDLPGSRRTGRFLVYSGTHSITQVFEP